MLEYNMPREEFKFFIQKYAGMAQSVERRIGSAEVTGPIPVASFLESPCKRTFFVFLYYPDFAEMSTASCHIV